MVKQNTHLYKINAKNNEMFLLFSVSSISEKLFMVGMWKVAVLQ